MVAFYSVLLGPVVDKIGVKKSAIISSLLTTISGILLAVAEWEALLLIVVILIFPIAGAFAIPAGKIAPRKYEDQDTRLAAYSSFFWTLMLVQTITYGVGDAIHHGSDDDTLGMNTY